MVRPASSSESETSSEEFPLNKSRRKLKRLKRPSSGEQSSDDETNKRTSTDVWKEDTDRGSTIIYDEHSGPTSIHLPKDEQADVHKEKNTKMADLGGFVVLEPQSSQELAYSPGPVTATQSSSEGEVNIHSDEGFDGSSLGSSLIKLRNRVSSDHDDNNINMEQNKVPESKKASVSPTDPESGFENEDVFSPKGKRHNKSMVLDSSDSEGLPEDVDKLRESCDSDDDSNDINTSYKSRKRNSLDTDSDSDVDMKGHSSRVRLMKNRKEQWREKFHMYKDSKKRNLIDTWTKCWQLPVLVIKETMYFITSHVNKWQKWLNTCTDNSHVLHGYNM